MKIVAKFIELNQTKGKFPQAPSGRYINFLSDFLANEKGATRNDGIDAWHELKELNIPKNYESWREYKTKQI